MAFARRSFKGNAALTTLASTLSAGGTSFSVASGGGASYPTGGNGSFYVVIDRGLSTEEKILISSRSGDAFTVAVSGRGVDDTSAQAHSAGAAVEHCITAVDTDEANNWVSQLSAATTAKGDEAVASAANTLSKLAVGADATVRMADAAQVTGQKWIAPSGDATIGLTGVVTLKNSGVSAGVKGDATHVPQVTVDAQGRVTAETDVLITGVAPGGSAGGDLTGTYPSPTIGAGKVLQSYLATGYRATFSGTSAPGSPSAGDLWYDTTNKLVKIYNGTVWITVTPVSASVATQETTTSTSYTDLATSGPAVTVATGTSAIVTVAGVLTHSVGLDTFMSFAISGATTAAAVDNNAAYAFNANIGTSKMSLVTGLTAGNNTFTAKYKCASSGTASFLYRNISVVGIPT